MKTLNFKVFAIALVGLVPIGGCIEKQEDPCDKTQWENSEDRIIFVKASVAVPSFEYNNVIYIPTQASSVTITGTITKFYCSGDQSGSFDFRTSVYPINDILTLANIKIGGPYQFLFQNDEDWLKVEGRIRLEFPDGSVFRPVGSTFQSFTFDRIQLDINEMAHYVHFEFADTQYEKVNI